MNRIVLGTVLGLTVASAVGCGKASTDAASAQASVIPHSSASTATPAPAVSRTTLGSNNPYIVESDTDRLMKAVRVTQCDTTVSVRVTNVLNVAVIYGVTVAQFDATGTQIRMDTGWGNVVQPGVTGGDQIINYYTEPIPGRATCRVVRVIAEYPLDDD